MDKFIKELPVSILLGLWGGNGEVTLNDLVAAKLRIYLKDYPSYNLFVRKSISGNNIPDCIITKNNELYSIFEFKKESTLDSIKGALCQMLCYIKRAYKNSIVPFKHLIVWTPEYVVTFDWDTIELLYENFKLHYDNSTPSKYWNKAPKDVKYLFSNIECMWENKYYFNDSLDFNKLTRKLVA